MALAIDHIVISVNDVNAAIETYRGLGFNAFYGGKHASGITHNGLIVFSDGSYLELIGLVDPQQTGDKDYPGLVRADKSEGYTGFAPISDAMEADVTRMRAAGIDASAIRAGGRTRSDEVALKWQISSLDNGLNPFVITDETPRLLRVPAEGDNIEHQNTAQGVADIRIVAEDLAAAIKRYTGIVGMSPVMQEGQALFALASGTITLAAANAAESAYFKQYGAVPYQLTLIGQSDTILPEQAHGARFVFTG
jgi:catechol 2,3-dioxygenase-like lactoylglutathione lyase family enzyme